MTSLKSLILLLWVAVATSRFRRLNVNDVNVHVGPDTRRNPKPNKTNKKLAWFFSKGRQAIESMDVPSYDPDTEKQIVSLYKLMSGVRDAAVDSSREHEPSQETTRPDP
jgi:hypothetical protein